MSKDAEPNSAQDIRVFETALPSALFDRILGAVRDVGDENLKDPYGATFWVPRGAEPANIVEETIAALIKLAVPPAACIGTEWWLGRLRYGQKLELHYDQDQTLYRKFGESEYPIYSSILYLNSYPSSPTVILGQTPDSDPKKHKPKKAAFREPVEAVANRYAVFRGDLRHGVIPDADNVNGDGREHQPEKRRLSLLVNYWHIRPMPPICRDYDGSIYGPLRQDKIMVSSGDESPQAIAQGIREMLVAGRFKKGV